MPKVVDHEERRKELIDAIWNVIARDGIEGVTLRNVAMAAGCTTGRISHYFSGREDLLSSALKLAHHEAALRMMSIARSKHDAKKRLTEVVYEGLPLDKRRLKEWKVWIVFWAAAASSSTLASVNSSRYQEWQGLLTRLLKDNGVLEHNLETQCNELLSIIDGIGIRVTLNPSPKNRAMARDLISGWVARL